MASVVALGQTKFRFREEILDSGCNQFGQFRPFDCLFEKTVVVATRFSKQVLECYLSLIVVVSIFARSWLCNFP